MLDASPILHSYHATRSVFWEQVTYELEKPTDRCGANRETSLTKYRLVTCWNKRVSLSTSVCFWRGGRYCFAVQSMIKGDSFAHERLEILPPPKLCRREGGKSENKFQYFFDWSKKSSASFLQYTTSSATRVVRAWANNTDTDNGTFTLVHEKQNHDLHRSIFRQLVPGLSPSLLAFGTSIFSTIVFFVLFLSFCADVDSRMSPIFALTGLRNLANVGKH